MISDFAWSRAIIVRGCLFSQVAPFLILWLDTADFVKVFCGREGSFSGIMGVSRLLVSSAKSGIYRAKPNKKTKQKKTNKTQGAHCHVILQVMSQSAFLTFQFFKAFFFFLVGWFSFCDFILLKYGGASGKESTCRRHKKCGFHPWIGKILWRKAWQPTPVFLPGQGSLAGYGPRGQKESDTT